ncbi:YcfL family protein [uncultured Vibrio sp.]|uniref:YcfL family protein n=1 Tax=uncultured Vibrio sp. TaxID=114054 RepID=UPI0025F689AC|nr:YcfL family protein [uncultured Vibrio sp.]
MKHWILVLFAAFVVAGCAENTAGLRVDGATQNVIFGDNVLGSRLSIDDIATTEVDGRARGVVRVTSQYTGDQHIQYRFYWYDDEGLEVNTKLSPWRKAIVRGYESIALSEVSINPNGTQFRIQIRELAQ